MNSAAKTTSSLRAREGATALLILGLLVLVPPHLVSRDSKEVVIAIEHFNPDCRKDTLYGRPGTNFQYIPTRIQWGRDTTRGNSNCTPDRKNRDSATVFDYPRWSRLSGSVTLQQLNHDTLTDIYLVIWGRATHGTVTRDTSLSIVIFGQKKLAKLRKIDIRKIDRHQDEPFVAMQFAEGEELKEKQSRDLTGSQSYLLELPDVDVVDSSENHQPLPTQAAPAPWVRVYPNPTVYSTNLEIREIPQGEYTVEVMALDGTVLHEQRLTIGTTGIFRTLDFGRLPSGTYQIRVRNGSTAIGTYPILILH